MHSDFLQEEHPDPHEEQIARDTLERFETGVKILKELGEAIKHQAKGVFRGTRRHFETNIEGGSS